MEPEGRGRDLVPMRPRRLLQWHRWRVIGRRCAAALLLALSPGPSMRSPDVARRVDLRSGGHVLLDSWCSALSRADIIRVNCQRSNVLQQSSLVIVLESRHLIGTHRACQGGRGYNGRGALRCFQEAAVLTLEDVEGLAAGL